MILVLITLVLFEVQANDFISIHPSSIPTRFPQPFNLTKRNLLVHYTSALKGELIFVERDRGL